MSQLEVKDLAELDRAKWTPVSAAPERVTLWILDLLLVLVSAVGGATDTTVGTVKVRRVNEPVTSLSSRS